MKNLVEVLIKAIVNNPDDVVVTESENEGYNGRKSYIYTVKVNPEDTGIVIGKHGQNIKSLRNIIKIKAIKDRVFADIRLEEPQQDQVQSE